jgi:hypothetical protein
MKPRPFTHCIHGHAMTGDNLYFNPKGARFCRACRRERERERVHARPKLIKTKASATVASRPSDELIAEARCRALAPPRDLTGMFFNDPPKGYSALDRREAL